MLLIASAIAFQVQAFDQGPAMFQQSTRSSADYPRERRAVPTLSQPSEPSFLDDDIRLTNEASDAIRAYLAMLAVTSGGDDEETPSDNLKEALTAVIMAGPVE